MRIDLPLCSFKDCRHNFDGNCRSEERKEKCEFDVYKKAFEEQPKIGGWIPCSERFPEENQNVIACFAHGTVTELRFYDKKFHGIYDYDEKVIVAWQPLPEAYHE